MRYWILHHQHKGLPIDLALKEAGWEYSQKADIALFDTNHHPKLVRMFEKRRSTLVIYPHTAVACWWYDGVMELPEEFKAILVVGEGQKEVQKIITPNIRVESIGWGLLSDFTVPEREEGKADYICTHAPSREQA